MSKRICFPTYADWEVAFKSLDAESCKELILAVFNYGLRKEISELSPMAKFAMDMIKPLMDRDWEKYNKITERNKANSKNAGRPKKSKEIENNPLDFLDSQNNPKKSTGTQSDPIINNKIVNNEYNIYLKGYEKFNLSFIEEPYKDSFIRWLEYKKGRGDKYKTQDSLQTAYKKLKNLSNDNPQEASEIVEQSIGNNWAGLFELKTQTNIINTGKIQKDGFGWNV